MGVMGGQTVVQHRCTVGQWWRRGTAAVAVVYAAAVMELLVLLHLLLLLLLVVMLLQLLLLVQRQRGQVRVRGGVQMMVLVRVVMRMVRMMRIAGQRTECSGGGGSSGRSRSGCRVMMVQRRCIERCSRAVGGGGRRCGGGGSNGGRTVLASGRVGGTEVATERKAVRIQEAGRSKGGQV